MDYSFRVLGIDYSTHSIDLVTLPFDDPEETLDDAEWRCVELLQQRRKRDELGEYGLRAALLVRDRLSGVLGWDSIALTFIEKPYSIGKATLAALSLVEGAIVASLPYLVRRSAVNDISAQEWKAAFVGRANASKSDVVARALELGLEPGLPQDAYDAAGIAWAGRAIQRADMDDARRWTGVA